MRNIVVVPYSEEEVMVFRSCFSLLFTLIYFIGFSDSLKQTIFSRANNIFKHDVTEVKLPQKGFDISDLSEEYTKYDTDSIYGQQLKKRLKRFTDHDTHSGSPLKFQVG